MLLNLTKRAISLLLVLFSLLILIFVIAQIVPSDPEDIAFTKFYNISAATFAMAFLATVNLFKQKLGSLAARLLLERLMYQLSSSTKS